MFSCCRYATDSKEWKERGVGDIKILKHPVRGTYRVLLRREQIHKIACNHLITTEMQLKPMAGSETAVCWFAMDYAEDEAKLEHLAVRFKTADTKNDFKEKFEMCQKELEKNPPKKDSSPVKVFMYPCYITFVEKQQLASQVTQRYMQSCFTHYSSPSRFPPPLLLPNPLIANPQLSQLLLLLQQHQLLSHPSLSLGFPLEVLEYHQWLLQSSLKKRRKNRLLGNLWDLRLSNPKLDLGNAKVALLSFLDFTHRRG